MDGLLDRLQSSLSDRFRIERMLGEGGAGVVYLAEDLKLDRKVAIKVLRPEIGQSLGTERFLREIRIAARLNHPNILSLIESGTADGLLYYVMFYVDGESLRSKLEREGQLPVDEAVRITREAAEALDHAHQAGLIHRDVKPENILMSAGHALVCDFGIARAIREVGGSRLTQTGIVIGTPAYMSPEQSTGDPVDLRSDIYSLGCVLFELLTSEVPHGSSSSQAMIARRVTEPPPRVRVVRDTVPEHVEEALTKALARTPADRFTCAADFSWALAEAGATARRTGSRKALRFDRRWPAALGGFLAVLAVSAIMALQMGREDSVVPLRTSFRQLTTQPGVEDSPSLSPDGKWIVFAGVDDGDRDVFLKSVGGQRAINLTEDVPDDDYSPVFSADGERIAFRSNRDGGGLFVMGRTGEAVRRVTSRGFNPVWSPDGTRLAYATEHVGLLPLNWEGPSELWVVDIDSGAETRISDGDAVSPAWSPDGQWMAYTARMSPLAQMDISVMPAEGGEPIAITSDKPADWSPTWSPDGRYLYFSSDRGGSMNLWRIPMEMGSGRPEGAAEAVTTPASFVAHPSVSGDGARVAFSSVQMSQNVYTADFDLATESLGEFEPLTTGSRQWSSPDPSPDGLRVAFYSRDLPEGDIYTVRSDGTGLRQLTADSALDRVPRWTTDGERISYFSNRSGPLQLWSIRGDGSGDQQLTFGGEWTSFAAWSPVGRRAAVNGPEVRILDLDAPSSAPVPIEHPLDTTLTGFTANDWSPDGRYLAGMVGMEDSGVVLYDIESGEYDRLTDFGQWPVWLPDSRNLLFVTGGDAFYLLDTATRQARRIYSERWDVVGPMRPTRDGKAVVFTRRVTEGDIWMVTIR
jgi:eukaryotic-like serine/threonine-protein kinase